MPSVRDLKSQKLTEMVNDEHISRLHGLTISRSACSHRSDDHTVF